MSNSDTYTCPMHTQVSSNHPGNCSKCGMRLVLKSSISHRGNENQSGQIKTDKADKLTQSKG